MFPVYILYQSVIVVAAYNLKPLGIAPLFEGPMLIVLTFAACFGGYEIYPARGLSATVVRLEAP